MAGSGGILKREYPANLTPYVTLICIVAAMGGLIFGYDIGSSGGVMSMDQFQKKFFLSTFRKKQAESSNNKYCYFNRPTVNLFLSSLYLAALLTSLVASMVTRKFGRKVSMLVGGVLCCSGAIISGAAKAICMLIIGRILLGFGIGFVHQSVPLYLSEMAPYKYRGALNIGFQLSITIGILIANLLNYFFSKIQGGWGWRLSLGGAMVPALIVTIGSLILPDTPNSMIERGDKENARRLLKRIRGIHDIEQEFSDLVAAGEVSNKIENPWRNLLHRKYRPHLTMAILIPFFQQLAGINAIVFFVPIFSYTVGFEDKSSLISGVLTGVINTAATLVSIYGVDKWGRRFLLLEGGVQMLLCQVATAVAIGAKFGVDGNTGELAKWYAIVAMMFISLYVVGFAWSWGPLGWLLPSEIFPLEIRSEAQSINVSVNMFFTVIISQLFLMMLCNFKFGLFIFSAFFVLLMSLFVFFFLPETNGIPIEQMGRVWNTHWYWSRFHHNFSCGCCLQIANTGQEVKTG